MAERGASGGASGGDGGIVLRAARDADGPAVIAVVAAIYAEYPGCILDVETELTELNAPASARRYGLGTRLLDLVEAEAAAR